MTTNSPKKTILHFFKPKEERKKVKKPEENEDVAVAIANDDEQGAPNEVSVVENTGDQPSRRRSTRACASQARLAWNGHLLEPSASSSDEENDSGRAKRTRKRNRGNSNGTQISIPKSKRSGKFANSKENKKKVKLDPEAQAFLRSGVPDVIEKAKAKKKSLENKKSEEDDFEEIEVIVKEKKNDLAEKRKTFDEATLAFLQSGVPSIVLKSKDVVNKKREQDDALLNLGFFPRILHTTVDNEENENSLASHDEYMQIPFQERDQAQAESEEVSLSYIFSTEGCSQSKLNCLSSNEDAFSCPVTFCCDNGNSKIPVMKTNNENKNQVNALPWIETMKPTSVKDLLVDLDGADTLTKWLKQWRRDIKDDGGTSRKLEKKRKRGNSSGSDFITSDEEESEMKKKSVLLTGPSGSGKTAAVYVLAKHLGFQVVEVNFSSRRAGKDVLQRVEEAVLSHRLESTHNCLLLFEDIDLYHPDEDEGFFSAVAQLITTAIRPIVMTSSIPITSWIDSKIEKKDPLRIQLNVPKPNVIAEKILKSHLKTILENNQQFVTENSVVIDHWLTSLVRHCGSDIRQSINQLQLLWTPSSKSECSRVPVRCLSFDGIHLYSNPFSIHSCDLNITRQRPISETVKNGTVEDDDVENDQVNMSLKGRQKRNLAELRELHQALETFADLDMISSVSMSVSSNKFTEFGDVEEAKLRRNYLSRMRLPFFTRMVDSIESRKKEGNLTKSNPLQEFLLESDADVDKWIEIDTLNDGISEYSYSTNPACNNGQHWENNGTVRTIVKNNKLDSLVRVQKRHGRVTSYFNRIDRNLVDNIFKTFDFQKEVDAVKIYS